ncbi:hypothetical protein [Thiorhodospira sibirica]|uniref:hypothetical protein n=1 Tax=Thiorhodospira sibirica TaxID=154347 RepID=UPI00131F355C|nr:hypothetical protein [Thiorhodospira sibirica]
MMRLPSPLRRYTLATALLALLALLAVVWSQSLSWREQRLAYWQTLSPPAPPAVADHPLMHHAHLTQATLPQALVERPLFSANRRPASAHADGANAQDAPLSQLILTSIVMTPHDSVAFFYRQDQAKTVKLRQGERFGAWQVAQIEAGRVIFAQAERRHTLDLQTPWSRP